MKKNYISPLNRTTTRSALSVLLLFITMLIILFYMAQNYRSNLIDFRKRELRRQVEISLNTIEPILQDFRENEIGKEQAISEAKTIIRRMTYTGETMKNYIFMSTYSGIMLVQPLEPWKQDTLQIDLQDSYGNYLIRDLIDAATSADGEGFVSYFYPPPGAETPGEKLSYVRGIPELDCYIGTGMFFDDIDKLFREYLFGPLLIIVIGFTSIYILIILYMRPLIKCFNLLLGSFHAISLNPDAVPDVPLDSFSEFSDEHDIISGFGDMLDKMHSSRRELKNSERRYRYLYEESLGVRIIIDRDGRIHSVNRSFLESLGLGADDYEGKTLYSVVKPGQENEIGKMIDAVYTSVYDEAVDYDLTDSNGNTRTILISDALVVPEDKSKVLITGVDITNRKLAEKKAATQREQLIQADKLASLGVLVSGVAHEINNPNQFILSNASLIEDLWDDIRPVLDSYAAENGDFIIKGANYSDIRNLIPGYLNGLTEGSRRIGKIVSDLKSLAKDSRGRQWAEFNINEVLQTSVSLCANMLKKATGNLSVEFSDNLPTSFGNIQQIEQVLINLIQNAAQSLDSMQDSISITTGMNNDGLIQVLIQDTGCGISEENLNRIFDPFFTTKREKGGTGIGMSISKNIIDEHQGQLNYYSEPGKGTAAELLLMVSSGNNEKEGKYGELS